MQSIRKRSFSGPKGGKFAKLFFPRDDMTMLVRESDLPDMIRRPIENSEARKVLAHISDWHEQENDQWKVRANAQQKKLDDGDPFGIAEVYKTLILRMESDKLSMADRRQLSQSERCLSEELAASLGQPVRTICQRMQEAALG